MKLYVGQYWVPFPRSEYGGTWTVVAQNAEEACELLKANDYYPEYHDLLRIEVDRAHVFELDSRVEYESQIVDHFYT